MVKGYIPLAEARATQADRLAEAAGSVAKEVSAAGRVGLLRGQAPIFVGIGASFAACAAAVWRLRERGVGTTRLNAGECPLPLPKSAEPVIAVSQSGKSLETLAALESVDRARRLLVVNAKESPISALSSAAIRLGGAPDSYASTVGYTATAMALGMIAEAWDGGAVSDSWTDVAGRVRALEAALTPRIEDFVPPLAGAHYVDCAAAAFSVGSAEAGALLLREVARLPSTGMSTRQYLHGAMESAGRGCHILIGEAREIELARTLARAGYETLIVTSLDAAPEARLRTIALPPHPPAHRPILEAVVLQTLAVEAALARGLDPDAFVFEHSDTKAS